MSLEQELGDFFKTNRKQAIILFIATVLPLISTFTIGYYVIQYNEYIKSFQTMEWLIVFGLLTITTSLAITTTTIIALTTSYFLGFNSLMYIVPTYMVSSLFGYYLSQFIDHNEFVGYLKSKKNLGTILDRMNDNAFKVVFLSRISPVLPFALMNIVLGFSGVKLKNFLAGSLLGMLPRTMFSIWIGANAENVYNAIKNPDKNLEYIFIFITTALSLYFINRILFKGIKLFDE